MNDNVSASQLIKNTAQQIAERIRHTVFGQDEAIDLLIAAFFASGHVIIEGPPGIAKTLLARSFSRALGLNFSRIQFTPDLMPSDITGVNIFDSKSSSFRFSPGPLFSDIILADEINRTPPKTQAAMLESMEEKQLTIDGDRKELSNLFFVIATQNPIEHIGTYPLPESQLDRFTLKIDLGYPSYEQERRVIETLSAKTEEQLFQNTAKVDLREVTIEAREALKSITLGGAISDYITRILRATREPSECPFGGKSASWNLACSFSKGAGSLFRSRLCYSR